MSKKVELLVSIITYAKEKDLKIDVQTKEDNVSRIVIDEKQNLLILS